MKNKILLSLGLGLLLVVKSYAQSSQKPEPALMPLSPPIKSEVFAGDKYLNFQMIVIKPIKAGSRFSFLNVTAFSANYKNEISKNEYFTQGLISYKVFKGFSVNSGATMHFINGFRPTAGLQYDYGSRQWFALLLPRFDLNESYNFETFGLLEYKPQINEKLGMYTRIQGLYVHNSKQNFHERSYLNLRLGLSHTNYVFGLGANFDRFGPFKAFQGNYGVFVSAQLF